MSAPGQGSPKVKLTPEMQAALLQELAEINDERALRGIARELDKQKPKPKSHSILGALANTFLGKNGSNAKYVQRSVVTPPDSPTSSNSDDESPSNSPRFDGLFVSNQNKPQSALRRAGAAVLNSTPGRNDPGRRYRV